MKSSTVRVISLQVSPDGMSKPRHPAPTHRQQYDVMKPGKLWVIFGTAKTALFFFFTQQDNATCSVHSRCLVYTAPHNYNWRPDQPEVPGSYFISASGHLKFAEGWSCLNLVPRIEPWRGIFIDHRCQLRPDLPHRRTPGTVQTHNRLQIGKIRTFPSYYTLDQPVQS